MFCCMTFLYLGLCSQASPYHYILNADVDAAEIFQQINRRIQYKGTESWHPMWVFMCAVIKCHTPQRVTNQVSLMPRFRAMWGQQNTWIQQITSNSNYQQVRSGRPCKWLFGAICVNKISNIWTVHAQGTNGLTLSFLTKYTRIFINRYATLIPRIQCLKYLKVLPNFYKKSTQHGLFIVGDQYMITSTWNRFLNIYTNKKQLCCKSLYSRMSVK